MRRGVRSGGVTRCEARFALVCMEGEVVSEVIERIRDAEARAEERARSARAEAKQLVTDAREASERLLEDMKKDVRGAERELVEKAKTVAGQEAEETKRASRAAVDKVGAEAEERVGAGVRRVLDSIAAAAS